MCLPRISKFLHTGSAAEKHLADGKNLQILASCELFLKLRVRSRIPVIFKETAKK
jgi:hypothetical protein